MRERELKLRHHRSAKRYPSVAPHAGARIETGSRAAILLTPVVAPHAGARIETGSFGLGKSLSRSLPMRERELKH